MGIYSLALTLSNAARLRSWQVEYRWTHWLGFAIWLGVVWLIHWQLARLLPERDPFIFPITALLTGWGLLTIWRLSSSLGLRQTAWLLLIGLLFMLAIHFDTRQVEGRILVYLRRFKYVWLTTGLLLTAATLFLGTNPLGAGPRLWLGCCGIYFQPSEPLKLLLIIYLAAYLADRQASAAPTSRLLPVLTPTLIMTGLALLLLIFQRDLGTAVIFLALYAIIVYTGTGNRKVIFISLLVLIVAAVAGYLLFGVVSQRVDAWINPWLDPAGRSYQIVQSLLAVANGGLFGRGVGMGSPSLVPIAQSDFIYSAITEETGLLGALAILAMLALLVDRGMRLALKSSDLFHRLLATGLVVHLVGQSILIIAGNLRLLPLTGVTLPFVSYGGSSLLVSFFELLCLVLISAHYEEIQEFEPEKITAHIKINLLLARGMMLGLAGAALIAGWWTIVRGPSLLTRTDNPRRSIADRYVKRGSLLDGHNQPLAESSGQPGSIQRNYPYAALGPLVGYTDPVYGQAGLEASLDSYLRGLQGYPALNTWWEHLLYGQPPPGLDVRLSLDLDLQAKADELMAGHQGGLVLMNAHSGEVLALSSSPTFDANQLESSWESLVTDPHAPLFDRATMGLYPARNALGGFLLAASQADPSAQLSSADLANCALIPASHSLADAVVAGCPAALESLASGLGEQNLISTLDSLGLYTAPQLSVETLASPKPGSISDIKTYLAGGQADPAPGATLLVSPAQMAVAAATLSNNGERPAPQLAMAVDTPLAGWVTLPKAGQSVRAFTVLSANDTARALTIGDMPLWQVSAAGSTIPGTGNNSSDGSTGYAWFLAGTDPDWEGAPLAIAVLLEENNPQLAQEIGSSLLENAILP